MKSIRSFLVIGICVLSVSGLKAQLRFPSIIGNHMVLQRESEVAIWGWDKLGAVITVTPSWNRLPVTTRAHREGRWMVTIQTPEAGGPFSIEIKGSNRVTLTDIWTGEVWLCSGQSNMEMPLRGWTEHNMPIAGSEEAIATADYPQIHLFTVKRATSFKPLDDCSGEWAACTPLTAKDFSAVGYFFGREIYKRLKVPIGLIFSAWGGTPAEAWTSREYIDKIPYFHGSSGHADPEAFHQKKLETYKKKQQQWLDQLNFSPGDATPGWAMPAFDDGQWSEIPVPSNWEATSIGHFEGTVTYRLEFKVPKKWIDQVNTLSLGPIDEMDITYLNEKLVGKQLSVYGWATPRVYEIPPGLLKHKGNILAVKVANTSGIGGINGKKSDLRIQPENSKKTGQSLAGAWRAKKSEAFDSIAPMPGCSHCALSQTPTTLYNGMIHPIIPYRIKGAIWYQGESNRYDGELYKKIFPNMIKNWRHDWGLGDFPFYFVQIAPFTYRDPYSTGLLREAQTYTYQHVPHTGMVVTMDIGSLKTIHPPNKEAVGFRLAQWALAKDYGMENLYYSGPMYRGYQKEGSKIRIYFSHFCGGLWSPDDTLSCFRIAGADRVFHKAKAVIDKITVVVWSDEVPDPVAVRFGWESTDIPNLFNMSRLPAWPFRTDDWEIERVK